MRNVTRASHKMILSGLETIRMNNIQTYAKTEKKAVTPKTPVPTIFLVSGAGMAETHTPLMTRRLKAALPTIVEGPSSPEKNSLPQISMTESKISGAEEPKAMRVRFAMVGFHTFTWNLCLVCGRISIQIILSALVIFSIAPMNWSHTIPMPKKVHSKPIKYRMARRGFGQACSHSPNKGKMRVPAPQASQGSGCTTATAESNASQLGSS
mmetsp:Transcript_130380/g.291023  ORF Transcript_130380/g.291023 Transcript_130380/m.291023 type:complete len:210 (-) Transcript_130380:112-741(-)